MIPAFASSRNSISRTISSPCTGCRWMASNSAWVSPPDFCSTRVGTPSLPMSCSMPAYRSEPTRSSRMPIARATSTDAADTRSL